MHGESELLDVKSVAKLLSCSPRTVWRLRDRGAIPPPIILARGIIRWRRATLLRWLDELQPSGRSTSGPSVEGGR
jgi:predicted DNA-binding transcriptional regulator AlpA